MADIGRRSFLTSAGAMAAAFAAARLSGAQSASNADAIKGTWVLQQTLTSSDLTSAMLAKALGESNIVGFSQRVSWIAIGGDLTLLESGYDMAAGKGLMYMPRFMAGEWTAASVFDAGSPYYTLTTGQKVPTPFFPDGSPNTIFETSWGNMVASLASWCRTRGVRELHLPWYGQNWAELNNGSEVRSQPGYTYAAWLNAHERLIDLAIAQSGKDLAVEFPLTGDGPLASSGEYPAVRDLSAYMASKNGPCQPNLFCQTNGWGPSTWGIGDFGATSAALEATLDGDLWSKPVYRGEQMIQGQDYDSWPAIFQQLYKNSATYCEVYAANFYDSNGNPQPHLADLRGEIVKFKSYVANATPKPPACHTTGREPHRP
jgi:hypothetical protein